MRKAHGGVDIVADLARACPALSLQQVGWVAVGRGEGWGGVVGGRVGGWLEEGPRASPRLDPSVLHAPGRWPLLSTHHPP